MNTFCIDRHVRSFIFKHQFLVCIIRGTKIVSFSFCIYCMARASLRFLTRRQQTMHGWCQFMWEWCWDSCYGRYFLPLEWFFYFLENLCCTLKIFSFSIFNHAKFYQICDFMMNVSTRDSLHFLSYLLNNNQSSHQTSYWFSINNL